MKVACLPGLLLLCAVSFTGCDKPPPPGTQLEQVPAGPSLPTRAQPRLPTIQLWLGQEAITAEMAVTFDQIRTGMMFRTNLAENEGMIFALAVPHRARFWMKNCYVPLSVAYIDPDGVIQDIHDLQPHTTNDVASVSDNIRFALETPQGWFARRGVRPGMVVRTERGSLMETFFPGETGR